MISESEVLDFLQAIEQGSITLTPQEDPQEVYAGDVTYSASNGWEITVFNDCNEWDYIDSIRASDGRTIGFTELGDMPGLRDALPTGEVAWMRYRIPGYLRFRCTRCGERLAEKGRTRVCTECGGTDPRAAGA